MKRRKPSEKPWTQIHHLMTDDLRGPGMMPRPKPQRAPKPRREPGECATPLRFDE